MCVTSHSIKLVYNYNIYIYIYIFISTCKFQHVNCRTAAVFLLVFLPPFPHPTQHFFATQALSCAHAVEPTFFTIVHSFQGGSIALKKHTPLFTKVPVYNLQRFIFSFLQISYPSIGCASGTPPFSQRFCCAVFSHINTEP